MLPIVKRKTKMSTLNDDGPQLNYVPYNIKNYREKFDNTYVNLGGLGMYNLNVLLNQVHV